MADRIPMTRAGYDKIKAELDELENVKMPEIEKRIAAVRAFHMAPSVELECPLLAVVAEDDFLVPCRASKAVAAQMPGARLATMKWGGHACNVTDPGQFNAIIKGFLGG